MAIGRLLFADKSRWPLLEKAVETLVVDQSLAVRACAVRCLIPVLNINRDRAVNLFLKLCIGGEAIMGTPDIDQFLHYALSSHYHELRDLTISMLTHKNKFAREI